jgi:hypothetical protein
MRADSLITNMSSGVFAAILDETQQRLVSGSKGAKPDQCAPLPIGGGVPQS